MCLGVRYGRDAEATARAPAPAPRLLVAAGVGAAVAVALGVYGRVHDPSQELVFRLFFSSTIAMKVWLGTIAVAFAVVQVLTALMAVRQVPGDGTGVAGQHPRVRSEVLIVRSKGLPSVALPVAGGLMFAVLVGAWYTSALWFIDEQGWPDL